MQAWRVASELPLKRPTTADLDVLVAELGELRSVAVFLSHQNRGLASAAVKQALRDASQLSAAAGDPSGIVADLRAEMRALLAALGQLNPAALVALRVFTFGQGSHLFITRFDAVLRSSGHAGPALTSGNSAPPSAAADAASMKRASDLVMSVASELELLISDDSVKVSYFERLATQLHEAVNSLGGRSEEDELAMVRLCVFLLCA